MLRDDCTLVSLEKLFLKRCTVEAQAHNRTPEFFFTLYADHNCLYCEEYCIPVYGLPWDFSNPPWDCRVVSSLAYYSSQFSKKEKNKLHSFGNTIARKGHKLSCSFFFIQKIYQICHIVCNTMCVVCMYVYGFIKINRWHFQFSSKNLKGSQVL